MELANDWAAALSRELPTAQSDWLNGWLSTSLPFSFTYNGNASSTFSNNWDFEAKPIKTTDAFTLKQLRWTDPQTKLEVVCELKRFSDFPAVEWVLKFKNAGAEDTPVIQDVQALSLSLQGSQQNAGYTVYAAEGGRTAPDDLMPIVWKSKPIADGDTLSLGGSTSSNNHLPFWNIETPDHRGVMVGVGWTGFWQSDMVVQGPHMQAQAGMTKTHFVLHPNEQVRSPRILLVFWEGKHRHGHNMLRQVLYKHYLHQVKGEPQKPLVTVNTCFTYHGRGGYLLEATEKTLRPLVRYRKRPVQPVWWESVSARRRVEPSDAGGG